MGCYCGNEASVDCKTMPGKKICDPNSGKFEICVSAGNQCGDTLPPSLAPVKDTCEGSTIVYCVDGYKTRTDCTSLGFSSCAALEVNGNRLGSVCK